MRYALRALPGYGVLLGRSTLTHQPPVDDFDGYARCVTTGALLLSHLGASVFGAALAIIGAVAVTASLGFTRTAVAGLILTTVAKHRLRGADPLFVLGLVIPVIQPYAGFALAAATAAPAVDLPRREATAVPGRLISTPRSPR